MTTLYSTVGVGRFFQLGAEPAGWKLPGFDDSAWGPAIAVIINYDAAGWGIIASTAWVCLTPYAVPDNTTWLFRAEFPAHSPGSGVLTILADNIVTDVWITGTALAGTPVGNVSLPNPAYTLALPEGVLSDSTANVLAVKILSAYGTMALRYRLVMNNWAHIYVGDVDFE